MSIRRVNDPGQIPLQMLRGEGGAPPGPPPAVLQSLPQDTVGLNKRPGGGPGSGISSSQRLSDLSPEQLGSLGGGSALESLAGSRSNLTVGEVQPLLRNKQALESIAGLMEKRSDLNVKDFVSRDLKGRVRIDPTYKDEEAMKFLEERKDMTPSQLSRMRADMTRLLKNPKMGKEATQKALKLMEKRPDLKPEDMSKLMDRIGKSVGLGDKNAGPDSGASALEMFDDASKLLTKRDGMHPDRVGELIGSVGNLTNKDDQDRASNVARGFKSAVKSLEKNPLRKPEDLSKMAATVGKHFAGDDGKAAGHRIDAFSTASKMAGDQTHLDAEGLNTMLTKAKKKNPKLQGPGQTGKLLNTLNQAESDLAQGKTNLTQMADPQHKAAPRSTPQAKIKEQARENAKSDEEKKQGNRAETQAKGANASPEAGKPRAEGAEGPKAPTQGGDAASPIVTRRSAGAGS